MTLRHERLKRSGASGAGSDATSDDNVRFAYECFMETGLTPAQALAATAKVEGLTAEAAKSALIRSGAVVLPLT